ncbi:hypothetical protein Hanom_Chr09g00795261 [Helianthus anomalus]
MVMSIDKKNSDNSKTNYLRSTKVKSYVIHGICHQLHECEITFVFPSPCPS